MILLAAHTSLPAQSLHTPAQPYASIDREAITYSGPGRSADYDLPGSEIRIGLILPLTGPRKTEGEALLAAAQLAIEDEAGAPMAGGIRLVLSTRDENGLWGRGANEIANLVVNDRAVALITSPDGNAAHLAEQVGNRLSVPVLTLASDPTTTQINIPWIFRVVPDDRVQARIFADEIFRKRSLLRVTLVSDRNHDGRAGRNAFLKAAQNVGGVAPSVVEIPTVSPRLEALAAEVHKTNPQALILWTGAESAANLMSSVQELEASAEIFVCFKAIQGPFLDWAQNHPEARYFSVSVLGNANSNHTFDQRFHHRVNSAPSPAARAMYEAIRTAAAAVRVAGPNRARVRDALASLHKQDGVCSSISFDGAGNYQGDIALISFRER